MATSLSSPWPLRCLPLAGTLSSSCRLWANITLANWGTGAEATMATSDGRLDERISTGMSGLDDILGGGFDPNRLYLVEGTPGSGKTTLALQFLLEGVKQGEKVL